MAHWRWPLYQLLGGPPIFTLKDYILPNIYFDDQTNVSDFINNKEWDTTKLKAVLQDEAVEFINNIQIPQNNIPDRLYWAPNKSGWFSTKTAFELITNQTNPPTDLSWVWKLDTYPKVKNFLWKICHDGLPTKARLSEKHVSVPLACDACNNPFEDLNHFLFKCPKTLE